MSESIFTKIIQRQIAADIVYETDEVIAFRDINPQAPIHILIIPKKYLSDISDAKDEDMELLGKLLLAVRDIAAKEKLEKGYRIVINKGESAGQTVFHLHIHLMGGRDFGWPPG